MLLVKFPAAEGEKMTRRHILFTLLAAMALSSVIIIVSMAYSMKNRRVEAHRQELENSVVETQPEIGFTLKEYNGELAVFRGGSDTPYRRLGISTVVMTEDDQLQLKNGIFVHTQNELNRLIEDYTS